MMLVSIDNPLTAVALLLWCPRCFFDRSSELEEATAALKLSTTEVASAAVSVVGRPSALMILTGSICLICLLIRERISLHL